MGAAGRLASSLQDSQAVAVALKEAAILAVAAQEAGPWGAAAWEAAASMEAAFGTVVHRSLPALAKSRSARLRAR